MAYHLLNPFRFEHLVMLAGGALAWNFTGTTREFIAVFLPVILFAWFYDFLRVFSDGANQIVTIGEVRELELALFGWWEDGERVGPVEFFAQHNHPLLDLLGAPVYASHVATIILFGGVLWWSARTRKGVAEEGRLHRFLWGFLMLNMVGFCIQVLYPVAPPWYVEQFGYAMPANGISGDPGGLGRVDALIGLDYFQGVYEQASYVFGAVPSLHVAYPVWLALNVRHRLWQGLCVLYALAMSFFAVYFIHHYVVDVIAGAAVSLLVCALFVWTPLGAVPLRVHRWLGAHFLEEPKRPFIWERIQ